MQVARGRQVQVDRQTTAAARFVALGTCGILFLSVPWCREMATSCSQGPRPCATSKTGPPGADGSNRVGKGGGPTEGAEPTASPRQLAPLRAAFVNTDAPTNATGVVPQPQRGIHSMSSTQRDWRWGRPRPRGTERVVGAQIGNGGCRQRGMSTTPTG